MPTAYAIANEGRRIVGCERVSLVLWKRGRCEVLAVSGLDSLDRRAAQVKRLAELTRCVLKALASRFGIRTRPAMCRRKSKRR